MARRAAVGDRRDESLDEVDDVLVREPAEQIEEAEDRLVRDASEQLERAFELARLELRHEPDRPIEEADEDEECRQPLAQRGEFRVVGVRRERCRGFALLFLEDGDDRVAFADLPLGDHAAEPLPVITDREIGGPRRSATADPPRLRDAFDDPP